MYDDESILFLDSDENSNLRYLCCYNWKEAQESESKQEEQARMDVTTKQVFFRASMVGKEGDNEDNLSLEEKLRRERTRQMTLGRRKEKKRKEVLTYET